MTNYTLDIILTGWLMLYAISRNSFFFSPKLAFWKEALFYYYNFVWKEVHMRTSYFFRREKSSEICQIIVWSFSRKCNVTIFSDSFQSIISFLEPRASNFPIYFHSREREISGMKVPFPGIPGKWSFISKFCSNFLIRCFVLKKNILLHCDKLV